MSTWIVTAVLLVCVFMAVKKIKKTGNRCSGCSGGSASCPGCSANRRKAWF